MAQVNLTNPFPDRHAQHGRSVFLPHPDFHLRAQRTGALGVVVNRPIEMTWAPCSTA